MQGELHKTAASKMKEIDKKRDNCLVIHYSCESFYNNTDGHSPRITSIAISNLDSHQTDSFSIHMIAEEMKYDLTELENEFDIVEKQMLDNFYDYVKEYKNCIWVHWNMRDVNYGFQAIEHRYKVLSGKPIIVENSKKVDLAKLLVNYYGKNYIGHPRMKKLMELNNLTHKDFLDGEAEAKAFQNREYVKLHQSTLRKVNIFTDFLDLSLQGKLKTKSKWYEQYGYSIQGLYEYSCNTWWIQLIFTAVNLLLGAIIGKFLF
ncbi:MAG: hypothetical protein ACLTA2_06215 [[Clostridium] innocuum]